MINTIKSFFKEKYEQLINMDDSPHRIAMGFALGVFIGILPFLGILVAVGLAVILKLNKPAALIGSVITNTWISLATFFVAGQIGCMILGYRWEDIFEQAKNTLLHFKWDEFFTITSMKILLPLFLGYVIIGIVCGLISYWIILAILKKKGRS